MSGHKIIDGLKHALAFAQGDSERGQLFHYPVARMTGFLATLTPDQRAKALAYRGPESHGQDEFRRGLPRKEK